MAQQPGPETAVIFPGYEKCGRMMMLCDAIDGQPSATQIASRMRQIAVNVGNLLDVLTASFATSCPEERCARLIERMAQAQCDLAPVFEWIELHRSLNPSRLLQNRLRRIFAEVLACAECDVPEYADEASQREPIEVPSDGWKRVSVLGSTITSYVAQLHGLARTIEGEHSPETVDATHPQRRLAVDVEAGLVYVGERGVALNGTLPVRKRLAKFIGDLIDADGSYLKTPENIKTRCIENQSPDIYDLIESQPGAGRRIPRDKIWRN